MASNKDRRLANLVNGLTSPPRQSEETAPARTVEEIELADEQKEKLERLRLSNRGRKPGSKVGVVKQRENRATFIIDPDIMRKVKYIALADTKLYKTILSEALTEYIDKWEETNGKITI